MQRKLLCTALATLLATPAFAASGPSLTIYHARNDALFSGGAQGPLNAGHALVHETRTLEVTAGSHELRIGGLPATLDPEAIAIDFGGPAVDVLGQRVVLASGSAHAALAGAIGSKVSVRTGGAGAGSTLTGTLIDASGLGLLVRDADGKVHFVHEYASLTLPADSVSGGSSLVLDLRARTGGRRDAQLTYTTSGLGWRAAYAATLTGGDSCRMHIKPEASIANRSGRDYRNVTVSLVAGQPNLGNQNVRMYAMSAAPVPMAAKARPMPSQSSLGDYRNFTLPGQVNLPSGTVTLTPLYPARDLACQRQYIVKGGNSFFPPRPRTSDRDSGDYQDRPIASVLAFTAPEALPAGNLRAWTAGRAGVPTLLGEGGLVDTPKGQRVAVQLGQSFNLRASRKRTSFEVNRSGHTMSEAFRITLSNAGDTARTVTVREHPDRWREWSLTSSSVKPSKRTTQTLEFKVPVPAHGKAVLDYAVRYTWTAQDM